MGHVRGLNAIPKQVSIEDRVREILEDNFWLYAIKPNTEYFRTHDDCDGDVTKGINVQFDQCGDAHILLQNMGHHACRFRTGGGGGNSLRVRNALLILAEAIRLDNEDE